MTTYKDFREHCFQQLSGKTEQEMTPSEYGIANRLVKLNFCIWIKKESGLYLKLIPPISENTTE